MNLLLIETAELSAGRVVELGDRRAHHLLEVLGVTAGDTVRAGVIGVGECQAAIVSKAASTVRLSIGPITRPARRPPVALILALPRPKVLSRVLRQAAAWGLARIDLVNAWRVEKSYWGSSRLAPSALRHELVLGCEQGATAWVPAIELHRLFMPFVRELPDGAATRLVLHPRAARPLEQCLPAHLETAVIAIGPEGGWIEPELASLAEAGFLPTSLGAPVLSVEAAVTAALAELAVVRRMRAGDASDHGAAPLD